MPPSLSDSVGVPPVTVTGPLSVTVRVTTWPAPRSPAPAVIPFPLAATDVTVGPCELDGLTWRPANVVAAPARFAALPAASLIVAPFGKFTCVIANAGTLLSAAPTV